MVRIIYRIATSGKLGWRYYYNNEGKQIISTFESKMFYVLAIDYYNGNVAIFLFDFIAYIVYQLILLRRSRITFEF